MIQTRLNKIPRELPEQRRDLKQGFESLKSAFDQEVKEYRQAGKHKTLEEKAIQGEIGYLEYCDRVSERELPLIDSHRNIKRVKEKTNSGTEFEAIRDNNGEGTYLCKYCGMEGCCETECSDCYAWWSREGKEGRMKGYDGIVKEYREKGLHFKVIE